jgi:nucleotide-binding universal stress UspA family protein
MGEQRILVPYDGSRHARHALLEAIEQGKSYAARLRIIYVMEVMPWEFGNDTAPGDLRQAFETLVKNSEDILKEAKEITASAGVEAELELIESSEQNIAKVILEQARLWPADMIIMGTHGRGTFQRMLLGSVAHGVAHHASIPVKIFTDKT